MSDVGETPLAGWTPLPKLLEQRLLPYKTLRTARDFLDRLGVPFVVICKQRHYQAGDIREALDQRKSCDAPA